MEHHDATGVTTPRQTVKASPHRHKWILSHGAPADPSDPWNSHAAPVSPRQNLSCARRKAVRYTPRQGKGRLLEAVGVLVGAPHKFLRAPDAPAQFSEWLTGCVRPCRCAIK